VGQNIDIREGPDGKGKMSMSEVFNNITSVVCGKLEEIIDQNEQRRQHDMAAGILHDDGSEGGVVGDFQDHNFMDFATDEFIAKVIRVRPASGITQAGDRENQGSNFFANTNILSSAAEGT